MQILMTTAAHERVRTRLATIAPDAEIITMAADGALDINGRTVEVKAVSPEVGWISIDGLFGGLEPALSEAMIASGSRWSQIAPAGVDRPVFRKMMEAGVRISKGSAQATPIAEYVVAHALSLLHPIAQQAELQRQHVWRRQEFREIGATRWMLIGYGAIGQLIAQRIRPFGVDITVVRRSAEADELVDRTIPLSEAATLLPQTDVVVLACALNDETRDLANAAFFSAMKPGSILINIARGGVLDEAALRAGLDRDQPAHAVLDVLVTEPAPADHWAWDHPKVRLTAHTSNAGDGNFERSDEQFLANLKRYLSGEPVQNEAHRSEVGL